MSVVAPTVQDMIIDCDSCTMRDIACEDCVVTFFHIPVGAPAARPVRTRTPTEIAEDERAALAALAGSGLVPPLRMLRAEPG